MILTCPACGTSYTVKDGAIPPAGRQVRCAACKHSWHQDAEQGTTDVAGEQPTPTREATMHDAAPVADERPVQVASVEEQRNPAEIDDTVEEPLSSVAYASDEPIQPAHTEALGTIDTAPAAVAAVEPAAPRDDAFDWTRGDELPEPRRRRGMIMVAALVLAVAALAAAAWFLAPREWLARAGVAQDGVSSPLKLMVTSQDRQKLASGNDLVSLSGRVINPTDATQTVPPLQADLRNGAGKLVYSWTIAPPAASLPPRASASFNAAELGVPADATSLTLRWAG